MIGLLCFVLAILVSPFKSKLRPEVENAVLRHQLIVLKRRLHGRVRLTNHDRWFFIQLYRWFPSILKVLTIIQPETLVHWHRASVRVARMVGNSVRRKPIPWRTAIPRSSIKARIWLMMRVQEPFQVANYDVHRATACCDRGSVRRDPDSERIRLLGSCSSLISSQLAVPAFLRIEVDLWFAS